MPAAPGSGGILRTALALVRTLTAISIRRDDEAAQETAAKGPGARYNQAFVT